MIQLDQSGRAGANPFQDAGAAGGDLAVDIDSIISTC